MNLLFPQPSQFILGRRPGISGYTGRSVHSSPVGSLGAV